MNKDWRCTCPTECPEFVDIEMDEYLAKGKDTYFASPKCKWINNHPDYVKILKRTKRYILFGYMTPEERLALKNKKTTYGGMTNFRFVNVDKLISIRFAFVEKDITYCTISVQYNNHKIKHYHAGTVYNPKDHYNQRTGMFIALKKALIQRWEDEHWQQPEWKQELWLKGYAHFLAAMMDGKIDKNEQPYDPDFI